MEKKNILKMGWLYENGKVALTNRFNGSKWYGISTLFFAMTIPNIRLSCLIKCAEGFL